MSYSILFKFSGHDVIRNTVKSRDARQSRVFEAKLINLLDLSREGGRGGEGGREGGRECV